MENQQNNDSLLEQLDFYSIVRDVLRNLLVIVLGALAVAMLVNVAARAEYRSTYSTNAVFVVTSRTSGNYAYNNLQAAATMAESYSNILGSNLLKKLVCRDLGVDSFNATMSAGAIEDTNLITLRVTSDTPENAYRITRAVMKNVSGLARVQRHGDGGAAGAFGSHRAGCRILNAEPDQARLCTGGCGACGGFCIPFLAQGYHPQREGTGE